MPDTEKIRETVLARTGSGQTLPAHKAVVEDVKYLLDHVAKLKAALERAGGLAARLEEFAENALRTDDRELYTAIANDLRTRLAVEGTAAQQSTAHACDNCDGVDPQTCLTAPKEN